MLATGKPGARAAHFARLAGTFWTGPHKVVACALTALLLAHILAGVYVQSLINSWNAAFFDAVEQKASADIGPLLWQFAGYVVIAGLVTAATVLVRMSLMLKVRSWVTARIMERWIATGAYVRLDRQAQGAETPEFRIADDVRNALDQFADLSVGLCTSVLLAITFFWVLARVGGSLEIAALGITVPAYFLIAALIYAFCMSGVASLVGWNLIGLMARKNHLEGVLRYELMCVRENATQIASKHVERQQAGLLDNALVQLIEGWRRVMFVQLRVLGVASSNAVLVGVFPVIISLPKYFSGEMSLGAMMQLATAFVQVQLALNWIVDNFIRFAELSASANRVGEFIAAIERNGQKEAEEAEISATAGAGGEARRVGIVRGHDQTEGICSLSRARGSPRRSRDRAWTGRARGPWPAGARLAASAGAGLRGQRLARSAGAFDRLHRRRGASVASDPAQLGALLGGPSPARRADRGKAAQGLSQADGVRPTGAGRATGLVGTARP